MRCSDMSLYTLKQLDLLEQTNFEIRYINARYHARLLRPMEPFGSRLIGDPFSHIRRASA